MVVATVDEAAYNWLREVAMGELSSIKKGLRRLDAAWYAAMAQRWSKIKMNKRGRIELIKEICRGMEVLDIGCVGGATPYGHPHWLHGHICEVAKKTVGIDSNAEGIEKLKKNRYDVIHANAEGFDLGKKFDVIVAGEIIEHLDNLGLFLDCVKRHLCNDAVFVLTTPNLHAAYLFKSTLFGRTKPTSHTHGYTIENLIFIRTARL